MDEAEDSPSEEVRLPKRARLEDLGALRFSGGSRPAEAAIPSNRQPAMHTKALRSVLKGTCSSAPVQSCTCAHLYTAPTLLMVSGFACSVCCEGR